MSTLTTLETLLAQFELYEPDIGREFRFSPHVLMLGLGRNELTAWEASQLNFFYGPTNTASFEFFLNALRLPPALASKAVAVAAAPNPWWQNSLTTHERIERIRVSPAEYELRYANKNGHYQMRLIAVPPGDEQRAALEQALATAPDLPLRALARGAPLPQASLEQWNLIPAWDTLAVSASNKSPDVLALGVRFLCRALVVYPAHLLLWRGVNGEMVVRTFVENRLNQKQADFNAVAAMLPAAPAEFWAAPSLPDVPLPHELRPDPGLSAHLSLPTLWPKPEENQLFMEAMQKVYKNLPKKVMKLSQPKR
jgi:hypothetical protein